MRDPRIERSAVPAPEPFSDDELADLALAAPVDRPLDEDAVPLSVVPLRAPRATPRLYMPPALAGRRPLAPPGGPGGDRRFLIIDAFGLCSTYGQLVFA